MSILFIAVMIKLSSFNYVYVLVSFFFLFLMFGMLSEQGKFNQKHVFFLSGTLLLLSLLLLLLLLRYLCVYLTICVSVCHQ